MRSNRSVALYRPDLLEEWDFDKNKYLYLPTEVSVGSAKRVWWKCLKGHKSYLSSICNKANGRGCPECARILRGKKTSERAVSKNSFVINHSELIKEWNFEKNSNIDINKLSSKAHKKVWWKCTKCGFEWESTIANRTAGKGCPRCGRKIDYVKRYGQKLLEHSLEQEYPDLMQDWDYSKNTINPSEILPHSTKQVWWKCPRCGYEWKSSIRNRVDGFGCKHCTNIEKQKKRKKTFAAKNSLVVKRPDIAAEFDTELNNGISVSEISAGTRDEYWWKCNICGTRWKASPLRRTHRADNCPNCRKNATSFAEQAIFFYAKQAFKNVVNRWSELGFEIDVYIPSKKTGIEYDGSYWHNNAKTYKKDLLKDEKCKENGIKLIRLRDPKLNALRSSIVISCKEPEIKDLEIALKKLFVLLDSTDIDISLERDRLKIISCYKKNLYENSFVNVYSYLLDEWDYEKNNPINPNTLSKGSGLQVWWKCKTCGYVWRTTLNTRTERGHGCPRCAIQSRAKLLRKNVINLETGERFKSVSDAAKSVGGRASSIGRVCHGTRTTAYGYHWKFANEYKKR